MQAPYGSWQSPITGDLIVAGSIGIGGARYAGDELYWQEARPQEGGRICIVHRNAEGDINDLIPPPFNARTRVHEYGGAAWINAAGAVYFSNFADQDLYRVEPGAEPERLTNEPTLRFANAIADTARNRLICIVESHGEGESEPENYLGAVSLDTGEVKMLASGHDFFSSPALSPDGTKLAWMTWDHPNMPWDATEIWLADIDGNGDLAATARIAGGPETAPQQPRFSPTGELWFVSDDTGWWNLYRYQNGQAINVRDCAAEFGQPHWQFGLCTFAFEPDGNIVCVYGEKNENRLARFDVGAMTLTDIPTRFNSIGGVALGDGKCTFTAASPTEFASIIELDLTTGEYEVFKRSNNIDLDTGYFSTPQPIEFTTAGEDVAHGFFYAPANTDFEAPADELPPLIVMLHGGPTSATHGTLTLGTQFWTSRGFAVLDVNYRGSTGYGREYRNKLRGQWGVAEVDDCVFGAQDLAGRGLVDGNRLAIRGGSAGGYTTLAALAFRDTFHAGASHYGIGDLEALARDTHKFESRYLDSMIGRYPQDIEIYKARSPINHVDQLNCPAIFFQGLEDKVVPPNQAEAMVDAIKGKGIPCAYVPFEGEQHGFRRAENIKRALELELYFYSRVFGFDTADTIDPVPIDNLP